ncbi:hypothetical protein HID58_086755 [Brassica napus]|uniref:Uncharacterized protein n=1 Tax=Brassica napus TaxID=3708 RepID=A0ABQ7XSR4_BRANA|nr:hypothetical protein HID58_086755 [Brassica napus]
MLVDFITAVSWIPKGTSKAMHDDAERPFKENINELIENGTIKKKRWACDDSNAVGIVRSTC